MLTHTAKDLLETRLIRGTGEQGLQVKGFNKGRFLRPKKLRKQALSKVFCAVKITGEVELL